LIIKNRIEDVTLEERVMLLIPSLLPYEVLKMTPLEMMVRSISNSSKNARKTSAFFRHLSEVSLERTIFIAS
jgi:hypothetical protein